MLSARIALIVLIALACTAHASHAQLRAELPGNYPTKPVRIIVGSVPGGGADIMARAAAQRLTDAVARAAGGGVQGVQIRSFMRDRCNPRWYRTGHARIRKLS